MLRGEYLRSKKCSLQDELTDWLADAQKVVIAGIGNPIRQDDFVGIKIVQNLRGKVSKKVCLLECETVPESFLLDIDEFNPTHVLLIDAAFMSLKPGEVCLVNPERIVDFSTVSTHMLPLRVFCEYIQQTMGSKIALLLIEPKNADFGEGLTSEVEAAVDKVTKILSKLLC